jgi:hypothetical protein
MKVGDLICAVGPSNWRICTDNRVEPIQPNELLMVFNFGEQWLEVIRSNGSKAFLTNGMVEHIELLNESW